MSDRKGERTISWHLETGIVGGDLEGEVTVPENATDEDIEHEVREDMWNFLSLSWREKEKSA